MAYVSIVFDKKAGQSILRLHLNNGRTVAVYEADAPEVLEKLGLREFTEDWVLDLEKDIG